LTLSCQLQFCSTAFVKGRQFQMSHFSKFTPPGPGLYEDFEKIRKMARTFK
jgi:hypothetical protein